MMEGGEFKGVEAIRVLGGEVRERGEGAGKFDRGRESWRKG